MSFYNSEGKNLYFSPGRDPALSVVLGIVSPLSTSFANTPSTPPASRPSSFSFSSLPPSYRACAAAWIPSPSRTRSRKPGFRLLRSATDALRKSLFGSVGVVGFEVTGLGSG